MPNRSGPAQGGVTLIEMAVVVFIIALLLGTILGPLSVQLRQREMRDAAVEIRAVREALVAFAQVNGSLPCPDTDRDGQGDGTAPGCAATIGTLPYAELGVGATDRWGRLYTYRVAPAFTYATNPGTLCNTTDAVLGLCDSGDIIVIDRGDDAATPATREYKFPVSLVVGAAAAVVSHGANGHCATLPDGSRLAAADGGACPAANVTGPDELENVDPDAVFVARLPSEERDPASCSDETEGPPYCELDDLVEWLPASVLFGKLIEAGQLP